MSLAELKKQQEDLQEEYDRELHKEYAEILTLLNRKYEFFWRMSKVLCWARPDQHDSSYNAPEEWIGAMREMIREGLVSVVPATAPIQLTITWKGRDLLERFGEKYIFEGLKV